MGGSDGRWASRGEVWCDKRNYTLGGTSVETRDFGEVNGEGGEDVGRRVAHPAPLSSRRLRLGVCQAFTVQRFENPLSAARSCGGGDGRH